MNSYRFLLGILSTVSFRRSFCIVLRKTFPIFTIKFLLIIVLLHASIFVHLLLFEYKKYID